MPFSRFQEGPHRGPGSGYDTQNRDSRLRYWFWFSWQKKHWSPPGTSPNPPTTASLNGVQRTSRSASNGTARQRTPRTGPRQGRKGRSRTATGGQPPERPPNRAKEGPRERKKNSRPSQKENPPTAGPAKHQRMRRIPAERKPHRKTQEVKPPGMSPNSVKPRCRQQVPGQAPRETARGE